MNKTKIEWCDFSWNPITGCNNGCSFCYARKIALRFTRHFKPTFHPERLVQPSKLKKPSRIFADSMSDFWSVGVKQDWRNKVFEVMRNTPQHTYLVLTKCPNKISIKDKIPDNCFLGVSVSYFDDRWRIMTLLSRHSKNTFVSIEPILSDMISEYVLCCDWIIIGGLTGKKNPFRPAKSAILDLIADCKRLNKPLFIKDNLGWSEKIQQFPKLKEVKPNSSQD